MDITRIWQQINLFPEVIFYSEKDLSIKDSVWEVPAKHSALQIQLHTILCIWHMSKSIKLDVSVQDASYMDAGGFVYRGGGRHLLSRGKELNV